MNRTNENKLTEMAAEESTAPDGFNRSWHRFLPTILFAICFLGLWIGRAMGMDSSLADLILLCAATTATLHVFGQRFPLQNVVGLAVTITTFSGLLLLVATVLRISLVLPLLNKNFSNLPAWTFPLLWIVALVNARAIAKLVLHRGRKIRNYGWWLIGLSSVLVASCNLPIEFNGRLFLIQFFLAAIAFAVATPWFIDKKNVAYIPDFQPLFIIVPIMCW